MTYEIEIAGKVTRVSPGAEGVWATVDRMMEGQPAGTIPTVRPVSDDAPAAAVVVSAPIAVSAAVVKCGRPGCNAPSYCDGCEGEGKNPPRPAVVVSTSRPITSTMAAMVAAVVTAPAFEPGVGFPVVIQGPDADRSRADLLAAQAAGFAPATPIYDRGTPVNSMGHKNARAMRAEWEAMPRLSEAAPTFIAQIKAEGRRDVMRPISSLAMRADGSLTGPEGETVILPEPDALTQLGTRMGIPHAGWLTGVWPALRAQAWNQLLATAIGHQGSTCPPEHELRRRLNGDQTLRLRLRGEEGAAPGMFAAVSEKYAPFDVDRVAGALADGLSGMPDARSEITYDGHSMQADVIFHSTVEPERMVAGEFFRTGIRVKADDTGGGSVHVSALAFQNLCLNLIIIDVGEFSLARLRHIGSSVRLASAFRQAVAKGQQAISHFVQAWGYATEQALAEPIGGGLVRPEGLRLLDDLQGDGTMTETELLSGVFLGLGKTGAVDLSADDLPGLLAAHALDNSGARQLAPVTRASVVNAITRYAHTEAGRFDMARQSELEAQAGGLLVSARGRTPAPLALLPPTRAEVRAYS